MKQSFFILTLFVISSCTEKQPKLEAPLFGNLGNYEMKISTQNPWAQKFFNQGLALTYGFNHAEAARSYREAARLDSNCAICYWGIALVNGPNINAPMFDSVYESTYKMAQKALSKMEFANEKEKALIQALTNRYPSPDKVSDRSAYDKAYAEAMKKVYVQFPEDNDVGALTAEAIMDVYPWNFWLKDGTAQPWTQEIVDIYENILKRDPNHPGANHYYIHVVEASKDAGRATASADLLRTLVPGAGHLVHMPSHIYIRTGRYHDAVISNEEAIRADSAYFAQCHAQGFYPASYATHNVHFLFITAAFEGRQADAINAAQKITHKMEDSSLLMHDPVWGPTMQHFSLMELIAFVRFAKWDDI
jgi:tetratricopeptide (TPR) repeat protein